VVVVVAHVGGVRKEGSGDAIFFFSSSSSVSVITASPLPPITKMASWKRLTADSVRVSGRTWGPLMCASLKISYPTEKKKTAIPQPFKRDSKHRELTTL
jgi:hypothetical protein